MPPSIAAFLLPGLGHWRAGRREQGLSILAATAGIALVLGWWAGIGGRPAWWLALAMGARGSRGAAATLVAGVVPALLVPAVSLAFVGLVQGAGISANFPNQPAATQP